MLLALLVLLGRPVASRRRSGQPEAAYILSSALEVPVRREKGLLERSAGLAPIEPHRCHAVDSYGRNRAGRGGSLEGALLTVLVVIGEVEEPGGAVVSVILFVSDEPALEASVGAFDDMPIGLGLCSPRGVLESTVVASVQDMYPTLCHGLINFYTYVAVTRGFAPRQRCPRRSQQKPAQWTCSRDSCPARAHGVSRG